MGSNVSTPSVSTDITSISYNICPKLTANSTLDTSTVQFRPNPTCKASAATYDSSAGVDSKCLVMNLQNRLADAFAEEDPLTQQGFGLKPTTDPTDIKLQLMQQVERKCGTQSDVVAASLRNTIVSSCDWHFVQNATTKSACESNALQEIANQLSVKRAAEKRRSTIVWLLIGEGTLTDIMTRILILLVMMAILYYLYAFVCKLGFPSEPKLKLGKPVQVVYTLQN